MGAHLCIQRCSTETPKLCSSLLTMAQIQPPTSRAGRRIYIQHLKADIWKPYNALSRVVQTCQSGPRCDGLFALHFGKSTCPSVSAKFEAFSSPDKGGVTPWHLASRKDHVEVTRFLVKSRQQHRHRYYSPCLDELCCIESATGTCMCSPSPRAVLFRSD